MDEPASTSDVLGRALSDISAGDPPEPAPTPTAATPQPAVQPASALESEPGPNVDRLVGRLKALGVSENDLDQVRRHYEGYTKSREVASPEPVNHWRLAADEIMDRVDPSERGNHEEFRRQYGDQAYVAAIHRNDAKAQEPEPEPEPNEDSRPLKEQVKDILEEFMAPYMGSIVESSRDRARSRLQENAKPYLEGLKVPEHARDYLLADIEREVARALRTGARPSLQSIVNERWEALRPVLDSHGKVTTDGLKAVTRPAAAPAIKPSASTDGPRMREPDTSGESTIKGRLGSAISAALEAATPEGAE